MYRKFLFALAASLSIVLAGCSGSDVANLVGGVSRNADVNRYNAAVDVWNTAIRAMDAAEDAALSRVNAAQSNQSQSSINAAVTANNRYYNAAQTALAAGQRQQSLAPRAGVSAADQRQIARSISNVRDGIDTARGWHNTLDTLSRSIGGGWIGPLGGGSSGGGSGSGSSASGSAIYDVSRPPDLLLAIALAYDVTSSGTITKRPTQSSGRTVESYTDRHGNEVRISLSGPRRNNDHDTTYNWHFVDGRPNPDWFSSWRTINRVPLFIDTHDHSNNGETHRVLLAAGRYSAAAVTGHYDPASSRGGSDIYAVSYGDYTPSRPTISATYRGAMIGTELITRAALEGQASITYSVASNELDIRLYGITQYRDDDDVTAGTYGGDSEFRWNDVSLGASNDTTDTILYYSEGDEVDLRASFYGPNAEEFSGTFETPSSNGSHVIGAWLAKR